MTTATLHYSVRVKDNLVTLSASVTGKNRNAVRAQINTTAKRIVKESGGAIILIRNVNPRIEWDS